MNERTAPDPRDAGSYSVEFAVAFAIVLIGILLAAVAYQTSQSTATVNAAAREGARAASLAPSAADARAAASEVVRSRIAPGAGPCTTVDVATATDSFHAAGTVRVTVTCRTGSLLGHHRVVRADADEVIDRYRGGLG